MDGIARRACAALVLALAATLCAAAPALATDGSVKGKKWHDLNANGVKDAGEPAVANWWIYLDTDRDGVRDANEPAAKTDAWGNYAITGIQWWKPNHEPRTYDVREKPVASQPLPLDQCSFPAGCKHTLTFSNGSHIYSGKDFGNYQRGKIVIKKINVGGTQTDAFDFTSAALGDFSLAASETAGKTFSPLKPGTYGVAELAHAGYDLTGSECSDGSDPAAIALSSGETVTCTFTNTRASGQIKVVKQLVPSNDPGTFDLSVDGDTVVSGGDGATATVSVPAGSGHSVAEAGATLGDYVSSVTCTDGSSGTTSASGITVTAGEMTVCTFTNTRKATVTVTKTEGGGSALSQSWQFLLTGGPDHVQIARSTGEDGNPLDFGQLLPGSYSLCEVELPEGWKSSLGPVVDGKVCVDLTLEAGEAEAVAVDNIRPAIQLLKQVRRGGDQEWSKDATLVVGQTAEYLLTVTNAGVGALIGVEVADDRCDAEPAYAGGDADGDSELDETEAWTYRCDHMVTAADGAQYVNTAEVTGTDKRENPVRDTDTATVNVTTPATPPPVNPPSSHPDRQQVLPEEIVSGTARLRGPSGCTRTPFKSTVRGRQIRRVTFYLDGRRVARVDAKRGQKTFAVRIDPRRIGFGVHRVRAVVVFAADSHTVGRTLRLSFHRCARQAGTPQFTG
jgi:hypothetical protein